MNNASGPWATTPSPSSGAQASASKTRRAGGSAPRPDHDLASRSVSVHHVRAVLAGAERQGLAVEQFLDRAGIPAELLADDHAHVASDQFTVLLRHLWRELDDEHLGLGPMRAKVGTFAMMCRVAVFGSRDLRAALRQCQEFYALLPSGLRLRLVEPNEAQAAGARDNARIEFGLPDSAADGLHLASEAVTVVAHRFAAWLIRRPIPLQRVEFAFPPPAHVREYECLYGAPIVFDAPGTALVFSTRLLDEPVLQDEEGLRVFLRQAPAPVLARPSYTSTVACRVRRILRHALPGPMPASDTVAEQLSVSSQTLRRQLAAEETSFQQIRDQLRRDHAVATLAGGKVSIECLSQQLGFSEPSAFHRAFRRWTGATPRAYQQGQGQ